jgi:hypothetical protein
MEGRAGADPTKKPVKNRRARRSGERPLFSPDLLALL